MFILSFKKNYKNYQIKKIVISGGGHNSRPSFFVVAKINLKRDVTF